MDNSDTKLNIMRLTTLYLTPFAIILVITGLLFSEQEIDSPKLILLLLFISSIFNIGSYFYALKNRDKLVQIGKAKMMINYAVNIILVYLMIKYWSIVWFLFLLTIIVISIFEERKNVLTTITSLSLMLVMIHYHHHILFGEKLGLMIVNIVAMFVVGLFINQITNDYKS